MRLIDVLKGMEQLVDLDALNGDMEITGLTCDSRTVRPGFIFAALPGAQVDGRDYITQAQDNGAVAVLAPQGTEANVPVIEVGNVRLLFAQMAANFYERQPETVAAITGTNGKTSTASFLSQIWQQLGHKSATVGTLGVHGSGFEEPGTLTTPDPVALHETLARLADGGVDHLAMEASSHGLEQFRLDGVKVQTAGFTNITRDHLDYHGTMENYFNAKLRLFSDVLVDGGTAVINADCAHMCTVVAEAEKRDLKILTFGRAGKDIRILERIPTGEGQDLSFMIGHQDYKVQLPLAGAFQVENVLCALGLAIALGADADTAVSAMEKLKGVPGRLQHVGGVNGGAVYVDYAHTPDALENVLNALRPHAQGKLRLVFGCGGDRDAGKRSQMGSVAANLADQIIVTDDNPRSENPAAIRQDIMQTCTNAMELGDRREAILEAVKSVGSGDVLVLAGKGHEQGQIIGDEVLPFDDVKEAQQAIEEVQA
ncbi:MAG: UDP-N-acetylmuramoyl-L-alanyl-D-glutamate--2,6-diaminopimelate ligase [Magnetovibrio sp.]|nr:UDP-N-acetylmuramoyl-L-alanyl-D-glutamate--2,6-diaminopimelate ligase [Magnetovibrio sp.]